METTRRERNEEEVNVAWGTMKNYLMKEAEEIVGMTEIKKIRKAWITGEMLEKMEKRRK